MTGEKVIKNVRPFWLTAQVDGKTKDVGTGPKCLTGGMGVQVAANVDGASKQIVTISCYHTSCAVIPARLGILVQAPGMEYRWLGGDPEPTLAETMLRMQKLTVNFNKIQDLEITAEDLIINVLHCLLDHGHHNPSLVLESAMGQFRRELTRKRLGLVARERV